MSGNIFGTIFRVMTFGESHGAATGCVIDGCPAGLALDENLIMADLEKRRPGQGAASTARAEPDRPEILSGVFNGRTLGTPIAIIIRNTDQHSADYEALRDVYRPGHADAMWDAKYGFRDYRGGGRSSARETAARVAAGAVARAFLAHNGIIVRAWASSIAGIEAPDQSADEFDYEETAHNSLRLPSKETYNKAISVIEQLRAQGDSAGGTVTCVAEGVPAGLGEPVFGKLDAVLGAALFSIGAVKGVEIGIGNAAALSKGSLNNDMPLAGAASLQSGASGGSFAANNSGGVLGGISSGMPIVVRAAFKPVPSIGKKQLTVDSSGKECEIEIRGRHDVCVVPRAAAVVEAMTALCLADLILQNRSARI